MSSRIAVMHSYLSSIRFAPDEAIASLKRLVCFFDRLAIVDLYDKSLFHYRRYEPTRFLIENGIMFNPYEPYYNESIELSKSNPDLSELLDLYAKVQRRNTTLNFLDRLTGRGKFSEDYYVASRLNIDAEECLIRCICAAINQSHIAIPVLSSFGNIPPLSKADRHDVIEIVLKALPMPSPKTPWEQILEYRNDPDIKGALSGLRKWIHEMARSDLPVAEVQDKLDWMIREYKSHVKRHRLEIDVGTVESVLTIGAEIIENITTLNLSKAIKASFSLKHRKIQLLQSELSAPNQEVAFIVKTQEAFR